MSLTIKYKDFPEHDLFKIIDEKNDIVNFEIEELDGTKVIAGKIISKNGVKKLRDKFGLKVVFLHFDKETKATTIVPFPIPESIELSENNRLIYCFGAIQNKDNTCESFEVGEINTKNLTGISAKFPIAILYKRTYGRVILDHLKLYEFYTEEEAEEFKERLSKGEETEEFKSDKILTEIKCDSCKKVIEGDEEKIKAKRRIEIFGEILCDKCVATKYAPRGGKKEEKEEEKKDEKNT